MKLIELLQKRGYTPYLLAHRTGISESTIYSFIKKNSSIKSMKFENVYLIAKELKIPVDKIYHILD